MSARQTGVWLFVVACASSADPAPREPVVAHIANDAPSFYRIQVPKSVSSFQIHLEADRPVAFMAAVGYFPMESHYDISNFPAWALGKTKSTIDIAVSDFRKSPCDEDMFTEHPPQSSNGIRGWMTQCLERMEAQPGLRCGSSSASGVERSSRQSPAGAATDIASDLAGGRRLVTDASPNFPAQGYTCNKYVDACTDGTCPSKRGPTVCNITGLVQGEGDCLCQRGFCEVSGRCIGADLVDSSCMKITGQTCPFYTCDAQFGPTHCEDGLCVCQPGHCAINGVCHTGAMCEELGMEGMCDAVPAGKAVSTVDGIDVTNSHERRLDSVAEVAPTDADCCQMVNTARTVLPGQFARCAASHFFALSRGVRVPILQTSWTEEHAGNASDTVDLVISMLASDSWPDPVPQDGVLVKISLSPSVAEPTRDSLKLSTQMEHFQTFEELISPSWLVPDLAPVMQQLETPLLSLRGADANAGATPAHALSIDLVAGQLKVLHVSEEALEAAEEGGDGLLQLHAFNLPAGSQVLHGLSWPEPRSVMDFGRASLAENTSDGGSVWRATVLNSRHFVIVPSASGRCSFFFGLQPLDPVSLSNGARRDTRLQRKTPMIRKIGFFSFPTFVAALAYFFLMVMLAVSLACLWQRMSSGDTVACAASGWASYICEVLFGRGRREAHQQADYLAVSATEPQSGLELAPLESGIASADPVHEQATPIFGSLKTLGIAAKEAALSRSDFDFGIGSVTRRLMSVSTRAGTSRLGTLRSRRDDGDGAYGFAHGDADWGEDEVRGLLQVDSRDEDETEHSAIAAFLKLRPAARDSVGDDEDQESSARPLVGTERAGLLSR